MVVIGDCLSSQSRQNNAEEYCQLTSKVATKRGSNSIWTKCIAKHLPLIASSCHSTHFHQNQRSTYLAY